MQAPLYQVALAAVDFMAQVALLVLYPAVYKVLVAADLKEMGEWVQELALPTNLLELAVVH